MEYLQQTVKQTWNLCVDTFKYIFTNETTKGLRFGATFDAIFIAYTLITVKNLKFYQFINKTLHKSTPPSFYNFVKLCGIEMGSIALISYALVQMYDKFYLENYLKKVDDLYNENSVQTTPPFRPGQVHEAGVRIRLGRTDKVPSLDRFHSVYIEIYGDKLKELPKLPDNIFGLHLNLNEYTGSTFTIQQLPQNIFILLIDTKASDIVIHNLKDTRIRNLHINECDLSKIQCDNAITSVERERINKNTRHVTISDFSPNLDELYFRGINTLTMPELPSTLKVFVFTITKNTKIPKLPEGIVSLSLAGNIRCNNLDNIQLPKSLHNLDLRCINISRIENEDLPANLRNIDILHTPLANNLHTVDIHEALLPKHLLRSYTFDVNTIQSENLWNRPYHITDDIQLLKRTFPEYDSIQENIEQFRNLLDEYKKDEAVKRNYKYKLEFIEKFWNPERGDKMWWFWEEDTRLLFN